MTKAMAPLKVIFFPFMAQGHMLPMVDMANLFASRGVATTIFTTPHNASLIHPSIISSNVHLHVVPFPSVPGFPDNCENLSVMTAITDINVRFLFFKAISQLRDPFEQLLIDSSPDCVVTDMFLPWTLDVAAAHNVPRLMFHGTNFFSRCAFYSLDKYKPYEESDSFALPGLPHEIRMLKSQIDFSRINDPVRSEFFQKIRESEEKSYGVVVNSFYELEPDYVHYYRTAMGRKSWHIGPVSLCGKRGSNDANEPCVDWLDSRNTVGTVLYVCFGSMADFSPSQVSELASGLEASGCSFVWVVKKSNEEMLPQGFEERTRERGLVIKGWAPQTLILNHKAVGAFMTHCGWNSSLEGISAGLPLVTWPMFAEQFSNERLIVDVLKIGVSVGVKKYAMNPEDREVVSAETIESAVCAVMGDDGEEAEERRRKAEALGAAARRAVEEGGSSYVDMGNLMQELIDRRSSESLSI